MNLNKIILTSLVGITAVTGAFATDYETVTSKKYVDTKLSAKQDNIPATGESYTYGSLVETDTLGDTKERGIFGSTTASDYTAATHGSWVPTMGAMMSQITASAYDPDVLAIGTTETTAINKYSATFDGTTNNWPVADKDKLVDAEALAGGLALKQNKIEANDTTTYPNGSLVKYGTNAGELEHAKIVTSLTNNDTDIPTSKAVKTQVDAKQSKVNATGTDYRYNADTNPAADGSLVASTTTKGTVTERGIAKARKISATGALENGDWIPTVGMVINEAESAASGAINSITGTPGSIATYNNQGKLAGEVAIDTTTVTSGSSNIPTSGAVYTAVDAKQNKITAHAANAAAQLLTDGATDGAVGKVSIATTVTSGSSDIPTSGAVYTVVDTKQDKKECVGWYNTSNGTEYSTQPQDMTNVVCWLWDFPSV